MTGASRGIGAAMADAFESRGCVVGKLSRSGDPAADVGDADSIARALEDFGAIDVLVANAGIAHYMPFAQMPLETVDELTRVNWLGTAYTVKAALPGMLERRRGQIVVVSSGAGLRSFPGAAVYGATKAAQRGFGEALGHELAGTGVGVTMVYPGQIRSGLHDHEKERMPDWYRLDRAVDPASRSPRRWSRRSNRGPREVFHPPNVRLLRIAHGLRPALADAPAAPHHAPERRTAPMSLPLKPPLKPQLAKSARELPTGEGWCYEPKWDGFRTIVFRDGDDVQLQSRNGRADEPLLPRRGGAGAGPTGRALRTGRRDGRDRRRRAGVRPALPAHSPAASRVERLRKETPASLVAFDLLAEGDETLLELPYTERRARLAKLVADPVELTPADRATQRPPGSGSPARARA